MVHDNIYGGTGTAPSPPKQVNISQPSPTYDVCPGCGRCRHCGRGPQVQPLTPMWPPQLPWNSTVWAYASGTTPTGSVGPLTTQYEINSFPSDAPA